MHDLCCNGKINFCPTLSLSRRSWTCSYGNLMVHFDNFIKLGLAQFRGLRILLDNEQTPPWKCREIRYLSACAVLS